LGVAGNIVWAGSSHPRGRAVAMVTYYFVRGAIIVG